MFSATMSKSIRQLAKNILHQPVEISLSIAKPAEGVDQKAYFVAEENKIKLVKHIISERKYNRLASIALAVLTNHYCFQIITINLPAASVSYILS